MPVLTDAKAILMPSTASKFSPSGKTDIPERVESANETEPLTVLGANSPSDASVWKRVKSLLQTRSQSAELQKKAAWLVTLA